MIGDDTLKLIGGAVGLTAIVGFGAAAVIEDRHERALLAGGHCRKVMEALYTPPPSAHTSCYGTNGGPPCSTWYSQPDPYPRSLWRCADPDAGGKGVEFWRRTAEEPQE